MFDLSNFISPKQLLVMKQEVVEETLAMAYPIVALQYRDGILLLAENPTVSLQKTSEIYDRIAFAGTGVFNDYERLRKAGVQLADIKGFQYSRIDVTARSIASEYSTVLGDIFMRQQVPMEVEILVAEIGKGPEDNRMYSIPFSGGLIEEQGIAVIGDYLKTEEEEIIRGRIRRFLLEQNPPPDLPLAEAAALAGAAIAEVREGGTMNVGHIELVVLDRTIEVERKFRRFSKSEITEMLAGPRPESA
jgi:proteasome alpha subunit